MSDFEIKLKELDDAIKNYTNPQELAVIINEVEEDDI